MRIIAGAYRGRTLAALGKGDQGAHLRPTTDRVREALFSHLLGGAYDDPIARSRVLDLFAGTGALGLEALSRGAAFATFVENGRKSGQLVRDNIARCRADGAACLIRRDATRLGRNEGPRSDLIFLDPPYGKGLGERALRSAWRGGWLAPGALIIWEESALMGPPDFCEMLAERRHGDTVVTIMRCTRDCPEGD